MKRLLQPFSRRQVRHRRIRTRVRGVAGCPRLSVWRGLRHLTAQLIDDTTGRTLVMVKSSDITPEAGAKATRRVALAEAVGKKLGAAAVERGIKAVVFDRGGYRYHGQVAAVADGARAAGLSF